MKPLNEFADSRNRSQAGQDIFVLTMHKWKRGGSYIEFGANDPVRHSNTALLSDEFGWTGVSYEICPEYAGIWKVRRPNDAFIVQDATAVEIVAPSGRIDYLSVDLDPPEASFIALERALNAGVRFSVITFEHDVWRGDDRVRHFSRELLAANGYKLAVPDVRVRVEWPDMGPEPVPYEDWYIDQQVIAV